MKIIIQSALGRFLSGVNGTSLSWSDEYPDAVIFETKKKAAQVMRDFKSTMRRLGCVSILDYGMESERVISEA